MGRLFWKFFLFVWLGQLTTMFGISAIFWVERQQDRVRWQAMQQGTDASTAPPPPPPQWRHPPRDGRMPPPHSPPPHPPLPLVRLLVTLLASLIFAALLAWYFSRPIRSLRTAFAAAATGNLNQRLGERMGRRDELSDLGRDFDRMAGQLSGLIESQQRLMHDVSHEMRSPLARLQAAIGLLRQQPEKLALSLDRIERESRRMDRLVGELLTLSRLDTGVTGRLDEEIYLADLLGIIVDDARFEADGRVVEAALGSEAGAEAGTEVLVLGNAELLHRAIENVVRNAVRHTPPGATIAIALFTAGKQATITVDDNGPGVPDAELDSIFQPFQRSGQGSNADGHGLGLAIARRIVAAHGGTIQAVRSRLGGLRVEIKLPVSGDLPPREA